MTQIESLAQLEHDQLYHSTFEHVVHAEERYEESRKAGRNARWLVAGAFPMMTLSRTAGVLMTGAGIALEANSKRRLEQARSAARAANQNARIIFDKKAHAGIGIVVIDSKK